MQNLNESTPMGEYPESFHHLCDHSISGDNGVSVYFRDIESKLIEHIQKFEVVLGCVAWLTSVPILKALSKKYASIIVQKEDFLRPDIGYTDSWKKNLHKLYSQIEGLDRYSFYGSVLSGMSTSGDSTIEGIRCVGNHNKDKNPAFPRMHNKFMLFCKWIDEEDGVSLGSYGAIRPYAVWTGSFNFTKNAGMSLENALYITQQDIVNAYYMEHGQIASLSEPLNWHSEWIAPEWRLGS